MIEVDRNNNQIDDRKIIYKMKVSQAVPYRPVKDNNDDVVKLTDSLKTFRPREKPEVYLTDVISPNNPRSRFSEF